MWSSVAKQLKQPNMPKLIVRQLEQKIVRKPKQQPGEQGVSMEEKPAASRGSRCSESQAGGHLSKKRLLLAMPNVGKDADFKRGPQIDRPVRL
jgi:hypothetical protein